ncbi:MAG: hypothetical protein JKY51_04405 [Opitutaceae bacterium]|nr:hypothetical protein [Opitutaceae bacterium]
MLHLLYEKLITHTPLYFRCVHFAGCSERTDETAVETSSTEQVEETAKETEKTGNSLLSGLKKSVESVSTEAKDVVTEPAPEEPVAEVAPKAVEVKPETVEAPAKASTSLMGSLKAATSEQSDALVSDLSAQASSLLSEYTEKFSTLSGSVKELEPLMAKAAGTLSPELTQSYDQLKALMPELSNLMGSLKNYQGTDLANLTAKLKTDYAETENLYKKVLALMPKTI